MDQEASGERDATRAVKTTKLLCFSTAGSAAAKNDNREEETEAKTKQAAGSRRSRDPNIAERDPSGAARAAQFRTDEEIERHTLIDY